MQVLEQGRRTRRPRTKPVGGGRAARGLPLERGGDVDRGVGDREEVRLEGPPRWRPGPWEEFPSWETSSPSKSKVEMGQATTKQGFRGFTNLE